eukprot:6288266-Prorocentrum_lima.AAC.1
MSNALACSCVDGGSHPPLWSRVAEPVRKGLDASVVMSSSVCGLVDDIPSNTACLRKELSDLL